MSDALCRMATGGGLSRRQLYTDDDEHIIDAKRPVILNGISDFVNRSDLADRCLFLNLPTISPKDRKSEAELNAQLVTVLPFVMADVFDCLQAILANQGKAKLECLPRLADFILWITAAEEILWLEPGSFYKMYSVNQDQANHVVLDSWLLTSHIEAFANNPKGWEGTASELLSLIRERTASDPMNDRFSLPKTPKVLSDQMRRFAPNFRKRGIDISFEQTAGGNSRRLILIRRI